MKDLLTLLGALAVAQAALLAAAALRLPARSHRAVPVMAALLLAAAGAFGAILASHQWRDVPLLWLVEIGSTLLAGPLFYAWVARVLEEERRGRLRAHLALPVLLTTYVAASLVLASATRVRPPQPPIVAILLFQVGYTAAAAILVLRRWREPEARGQRRFIALLVLLLAVVHAASFARWLRPEDHRLRDVVPAAGVLLMYALGFVALRQPRLLRLVGEAIPPGNGGAGEPAPGPERRRYESSPLRPEQVQLLRDRLRDHMAVARPFLRGDLTLPELARELDTLPTHLSRAVNESGESFPDLLARLRVEEAKRLLRDERLRHLTVDALGARAGFRSRSAFYDAFRRRVGVTPSAYRKAAAAGEQPPERMAEPS